MKSFIILVCLFCAFTTQAQNQSQPPVTSQPESDGLIVKELQSSLLYEDIEVGMLVLMTKGWGFVTPEKKIEIFPFVDEPEEYRTGYTGGYDKRQFSFIVVFQNLSAKGWRYYGRGLSFQGISGGTGLLLVRSKNFKAKE